MNTQQTQLYQRIQAFSLDASHADLCFSQRLARDNSWTQQYTQRVIEEYKKFIFLAMVAEHPVTASDQVDQVWHLHLTYTHSYWDEFCANVLHKPLHHNPTRGGSSEQENFHRWYNETLISYEKFFNQSPPFDIWPPPDIRFGKDVQFTRLNSHRYWIVPKPFFILPRLPSFYLPRLPLQQFMALALLSFISVLTISGFTVLLAENVVTHPIHLSSSEPVLSQAAENPPRPRNTPTSTPENNNHPTEEKSSWGFWLWLPLFLIFFLSGSRGNSSGGGSGGGSNDGCSGCGCM